MAVPAPLVAPAAADPDAEDPEEVVPVAAEAPDEGVPNSVTPDSRGPGMTEAEAPTPTRLPTPCCKNKQVRK